MFSSYKRLKGMLIEVSLFFLNVSFEKRHETDTPPSLSNLYGVKDAGNQA
jgi:hypothetical protein